MARKASKKRKPIYTDREMEMLGDGKLAYIKTLPSSEAKKAYPGVKGIPNGEILFALHGADGSPLALTDSLQAAIGHALGEDLEVAGLQ